MKFMHICPTEYLEPFCSGQRQHLLLAHLVEQDQKYQDWYRFNKTMRPDDLYILDNSAFEMYKEGREMYSSEKLIQMGTLCKANYIVMSDYPNQPSQKTIDSAMKLAPQFKEAGFRTFFCPQSIIGDLDDLVNCFLWALEAPEVDYIGFSILAIPNAYGVEKDNKLQRFMSRWKFCHLLDSHYNFFQQAKDNGKKIHFLGMTDGPNEIKLVEKWLPYIDTWDSSAAIWAGLNGIVFDGSPTGLITGKFEQPVDFSHCGASIDNRLLAEHNVHYINNLAKGNVLK